MMALQLMPRTSLGKYVTLTTSTALRSLSSSFLRHLHSMPPPPLRPCLHQARLRAIQIGARAEPSPLWRGPHVAGVRWMASKGAGGNKVSGGEGKKGKGKKGGVVETAQAQLHRMLTKELANEWKGIQETNSAPLKPPKVCDWARSSPFIMYSLWHCLPCSHTPHTFSFLAHAIWC